MRILISGSTGVVGTALIAALKSAGDEVVRLVRREPESFDEAVVGWDTAAGTIDREALASLGRLDAVVHLAGENIAKGRWTEAKKARIRDSRIEATGLLAGAMTEMDRPPATMICASAIGWYGDSGPEWVDESEPAADDFLGHVCRDWEAAAEPARWAGMRVVHLRFGIVLSTAGGALKEMLLPFRLCCGGKVASGNQYWSWVAIDDVVGAILHSLETDSLEGPVNVTSPEPVTNLEFTKTLGRVLRRPTILPMPAFLARLFLGEMADALLLASARVKSEVLSGSGYEFQHPQLEGALRHILGK